MSKAALSTAVLAMVALAGPAAGQAGEEVEAPAGQARPELQDGRWLPYLGCWVDASAPDGPMTCVVPEGEGVAFLTVTGSEVTDQRQLRADGSERPVDVSGCTGREAAEFSSDGYRVYTRADLTCETAERETRGLIAMVDENAWIEARAIDTGDGSVAWVKRYQPAPATRVEAAGTTARLADVSGQAVEAARVAASAPLAIQDVIEATGRTDPEAVRAWIVEQGDPLRLNADRLVQLADAGVPAEVIDVAVAVSFPDRFAVARQAPDYYGDDRFGYGRMGPWGVWSPFGPRFYDPFYYRYPYYGYNYYNYYGMYGSGYYGYNRPTVVVVAPVGSSSGGRMVKGRGYTRGSGDSATRPTVRVAPPSSSRVGTGYSGSSSGSRASKGKAKRRGSSGNGNGGG